MVVFFRVKTTPDIDKQYYKAVRFYPFSALKGAIERRMNRNKPMPSNFPSPSELASDCMEWLNESPDIKESITEYDKHDDPDFPIRHLENAFRILTEAGVEPFHKYCAKTRIPEADRRRVICKAQAVAAKEGDSRIDEILRSVGQAI